MLNLFIILMLLISGTCSYAAADPAQRMRDLNVQGIESPTQSIESPQAQVVAYGDNAVQHCYVFSTFAAIETDTGQVGAEAIRIRLREGDESAVDLCKDARRSEDRVIADAEGYVLGARGPFLFVTSTDSFGSPGSVSIFDASTGKKLFDVQRDAQRPLKTRFENGVLSLRFFLPLQLDCDLAVGSCWPQTLEKNHVPADAILVRPECGRRTENPKTVFLSTPVHVDDVTHVALIYDNSQPACDPAAP